MLAEKIQKGFTNQWWTAVQDATVMDSPPARLGGGAEVVVVHVRYNTDMGLDVRYFDLGADVPGHHPQATEETKP